MEAPNHIYVTLGQIRDDELDIYNYDDCVTYIRKDFIIDGLTGIMLNSKDALNAVFRMGQFIDTLNSL